VRVRGPGGVRDHPRGQGAGAHSRDGQRGHRNGRTGEARARVNRRGRHHDRPRGTGQTVDLPRDSALSRHGCYLPAPTVAEARAEILRHLRQIITRSTARRQACASRASTSVGTRRTSRAATLSGAR
jgi:hypothetical protein